MNCSCHQLRLTADGILNHFEYDSIQFKLSQCDPKANKKFTFEFLLKTITNKRRYQENKRREKTTRCRRHFHKILK
jgi:hypothetical protein